MIEFIFWIVWAVWVWKAALALMEMWRARKAMKEYASAVDDLGTSLEFANAYAINARPQNREEVEQIVAEIERCAVRCNATGERVNVAEKIANKRIKAMHIMMVLVLTVFAVQLIME